MGLALAVGGCAVVGSVSTVENSDAPPSCQSRLGSYVLAESGLELQGHEGGIKGELFPAGGHGKPGSRQPAHVLPRPSALAGGQRRGAGVQEQDRGHRGAGRRGRSIPTDANGEGQNAKAGHRRRSRVDSVPSTGRVESGRPHRRHRPPVHPHGVHLALQQGRVFAGAQFAGA